jgi:hypothetical protein
VAWHQEGCIGDHSFMAVVGMGTWFQTEMKGASEIKKPEFPRLWGCLGCLPPLDLGLL